MLGGTTPLYFKETNKHLMKSAIYLIVLALLASAISARLFFEKPKRGSKGRETINTFTARFDKLQEEMDAKIVFHRKNGPRQANARYQNYHQRNIYLARIGKGKDRTPVLVVKNGRRPRWSPDGKSIAFIRDTAIVVCDESGKNVRSLCTTEQEPLSLTFHPNGKAVVFTDDHQLKSVDIKSGEATVLLEGWWFHEVDISKDGTRIVATVRIGHGYHVYAFDLSTGKHWKLGPGCSASLSPDGNRVSNNLHGHKEVAIRKFSDGTIADTVSHPGKWTFDNQCFSNDNNWITSVNEGPYNEVFLHQIDIDRWVQVTDIGDADYPDLFILP